jgi:hypothetical protein
MYAAPRITRLPRYYGPLLSPHTARPVSRELPVDPTPITVGNSRVASGLLRVVGSRTGARLRRFSRSVAPTFPVGVPYEPNRKLVSSPRPIKPSVQISCTEFSCGLRIKGYGADQPIPAGWLSADGSTYHPIVVKQTECVVEPLRTPPLASESFVLSGAHQVSPNLLLHPELNVGKSPARVPHRKVVYPPRRIGLMSSITLPTGWLTYRRKISFSFRRSAVRFFGLGTKMGPPLSVTASDAAIVKSQEAKSLSLR